MPSLKALLLAGVFAGLGGLPAFAEQGAAPAPATLDPAAPDRVVIAPPLNDLGRAIKAALSARYAAAERGTRAWSAARDLYYFYGARHFEPLWVTSENGTAPAFSPTATKILDVFRSAEREGFNPADYLTPDIDIAEAGTDPQKLATLEAAFSAAAIRYAKDAWSGRIRPLDVDPDWTITPKRLDEAKTLIDLATSPDPDKLLLGLSPTHPEFLGLKAALAKFYDGTVIDEATVIPDGPLLKPGMNDERVTLLRQRLNVPEPEVPETAGAAATADITFDQPLVEAVKAFQNELGLNADGVVGPATIAALNGASATTKEDIIANMERWRWEPNDFGRFQVTVNIPEFRLWILRDSEVAYTTRVVVGRPENRTPVFNDEIEHVVVNPYWNVPPSIATKEIRPALIKNPGYLQSQNMEMLYGGKVVNASAIDWSSTNINQFQIRQLPGDGNALGKVKFLFPNSHDVYLHDTPSKSLFARSFRAYSHGCVRVENPMDFADALLANETKISRASLEALFGEKERWVTLSKSVPVHITYFTLRVDEDGTIRSYGDVYGANRRMIELLGLKAPERAPDTVADAAN